MQFLRQVFSESGTASFSRLSSFLALGAACAWVTKIVWTTHQLPDLQGLVLFIATLYGLGKAGETIQRVAGKNGKLPAVGGRQENADPSRSLS
jgi:hypothetical protein